MDPQSQPSENQEESPSVLLDFFRSTASGKSSSYSKALQSLTSFLNARNLTLEADGIYAEWLAYLWISGTSLKTALHYLDILASLLRQAFAEGLADEKALTKVTDLRTRLKNRGEELWKTPITDEQLTRLVTHLRQAHRLTGDLSLATDLLLLSIIYGGADPAELATLTTEEVETKIGETDDELARTTLREIKERQSNPRRKYLLNLDQSRRTPKQLRREVDRLFRQLTLLRSLPPAPDAASFVRSLLLQLSLKLGDYQRAANLFAPEASEAKRASEARDANLTGGGEFIRSVSEANPGASEARDGVSNANDPRAGLVERHERAQRSSCIEENLNLNSYLLTLSALLTNPLRWYAMRLRPHVPLSEVEAKIDLYQNEITRPAEMFYPHEEIAKRIGKKLVFKQKPIISDVVFIKTRQTDILPLFSKIGDLAWCYTLSGRSGAPYAAIPPAEFTRFQTAIGQFTPGDDPQPLNTLTPLPGERVVILSGPFAGRHATVESSIGGRLSASRELREHRGDQHGEEASASRAQDGAPTVLYRLMILADNGLEWRVTADPRTLRKL